MIESFRHKGLKRLYETGDGRKLPPSMLEKIEGVIALLDIAREPGDLDRPSLRLHPLKGTYPGFWVVTIRANWRIVFRIDDGRVFDVDFVDYH